MSVQSDSLDVPTEAVWPFSTDTASPAKSKGDSKIGAIIGGVTAGLLIFALILVAIVVPIERRRKRKKEIFARQKTNRDPPYDSFKALGLGELGGRGDPAGLGVAATYTSQDLNGTEITLNTKLSNSKQGYSGSHHDLVGMIPLLGYPSGAGYYHGGASSSPSSPPGTPLSPTQLAHSTESFNPYNEFFEEEARRMEAGAELYPSVMPPRPPQDAYARSSWTQHFQRSPARSQRALPAQPGSAPSSTPASLIRPLPLPTLTNTPIAKPAVTNVQPSDYRSLSGTLCFPPVSLDVDDNMNRHVPIPIDRNGVPSPPPSTSAFPNLLQRFQSMSSISDGDTMSLYSQMSMPRDPSDSHFSPSQGYAPPPVSLTAIAERLAFENGPGFSNEPASMVLTPTPKRTVKRSVKGKEKALPEGEEFQEVERKPVIRRLPVPPSPPPVSFDGVSTTITNTTATVTRTSPNPGVRPLPSIANRGRSSTMHAPASISASASTSTASSSSYAATSGSGFTSANGASSSKTSCEAACGSRSSDLDVAESSKMAMMKGPDTIAIGKMLQSRARRHSDVAFGLFHGSSSSSGGASIEGVVGSEGSSRVPSDDATGNVDKEDVVLIQDKGKGKMKAREQSQERVEKNLDVIVKTERTPIPIARGPSIRRLLVAERPEGPKGGRPKSRIRPRATSTSSVTGQPVPIQPINRSPSGRLRVKPHVLANAKANASTSSLALPETPRTLRTPNTPRSRRSSVSTPTADRSLAASSTAAIENNSREGQYDPSKAASSQTLLPPIETSSPVLHPLTGAFGLGRSMSTRSPETPGHKYDFDVERLRPFLPGTPPLKVGGRGRPEQPRGAKAKAALSPRAVVQAS